MPSVCMMKITPALAKILPNADEVFATADMIVKVKEPQPVEIKRLRPGQTLFTYLHLAPDPVQTKALMESGAICIAYETVTDARGGLPLLAPMSEVAGRMSIQAGAHCLEIAQGGRGALLGGVPGVQAAKVVVLGGGVVGSNAARMAMGLEAHVTVIDISLHTLYNLDLRFGASLNTIYSTIDAIEEHVTNADLVIGGVLLPGAAAPKLNEKDGRQWSGSVIVDVPSIRAGAETSTPPPMPTRPIWWMSIIIAGEHEGGWRRHPHSRRTTQPCRSHCALAELGPEAARTSRIVRRSECLQKHPDRRSGRGTGCRSKRRTRYWGCKRHSCFALASSPAAIPLT